MNDHAGEVPVAEEHFERAYRETGCPFGAFDRTSGRLVCAPGLVKARHAVWVWMRTNRMRDGRYPSYQEIADATGVPSHNGPLLACLSSIDPKTYAEIVKEATRDTQAKRLKAARANYAAFRKAEGTAGMSQDKLYKYRKMRREMGEEVVTYR